MSKIAYIGAAVIAAVTAALLYFWFRGKGDTTITPTSATGANTPTEPIAGIAASGYVNMEKELSLTPKMRPGTMTEITKATAQAGGAQNNVSLPAVAGNTIALGATPRGVENSPISWDTIQMGDYYLNPVTKARTYYQGKNIAGQSVWIYEGDSPSAVGATRYAELKAAGGGGNNPSSSFTQPIKSAADLVTQWMGSYSAKFMGQTFTADQFKLYRGAY